MNLSMDSITVTKECLYIKGKNFLYRGSLMTVVIIYCWTDGNRPPTLISGKGKARAGLSLSKSFFLPRSGTARPFGKSSRKWNGWIAETIRSDVSEGKSAWRGGSIFRRAFIVRLSAFSILAHCLTEAGAVW